MTILKLLIFMLKLTANFSQLDQNLIQIQDLFKLKYMLRIIEL